MNARGCGTRSSRKTSQPIANRIVSCRRGQAGTDRHVDAPPDFRFQFLQLHTDPCDPFAHRPSPLHQPMFASFAQDAISPQRNIRSLRQSSCSRTAATFCPVQHRSAPEVRGRLKHVPTLSEACAT